MKTIHKFCLVFLISSSLFIGKSDGGGLLGAVAVGACGGVCGAGFAACCSAAGGISVALLSNPITAPFASILTPWFAGGCWTGFGTCYTTCVGGALIAPSP